MNQKFNPLSLQTLTYTAISFTDLEILEHLLPEQMFREFLKFMLSDVEFCSQFQLKYVMSNDLIFCDDWNNISIINCFVLKEYFINFFHLLNSNFSFVLRGYRHHHHGNPEICVKCFKTLNTQNQQLYKYINVKIIMRKKLIDKKEILWCKKCKIRPLFFFKYLLFT